MHDDPYGWLEDVEGPRALAWVAAHNARTEAALFADPTFVAVRGEVLEVLEADDRVPVPSRHGDAVLEFWTDAAHRRGILRRSTWAAYRRGAPEWEVVLDVDALGAAEATSWVYRSASVRRPDRRRALVELSPGGSDASVTRELDLVEGRFVAPEDGGFVRPLGKGWAVWVDDDTLYVGDDRAPGSRTASGYPRTVRRWARGTPLEQAPVVFEGEVADVAVGASVATLPGFRHEVFTRSLDFFRARRWLRRGEDLVDLDVPDDADVDLHGPWILLRPRGDWSLRGVTHRGGSLLAGELERWLAGERRPRPVFTPNARSSLAGWSWTADHLLLALSEDVRDRIEVVTPGGDWPASPLRHAPAEWSVEARPVDADVRDDCFVVSQDFLHPLTLRLCAPGASPVVLRRAPQRFDPAGMAVVQHFARSADGTAVPYFVVGPEDPDADPGPTVMTGYGGFEVSLTPSYSATVGRAWLARGGRYVVANIRGGGEYGPAWHEAARRAQRHRAYEDFEAVADDLVRRGVTTAGQLGIVGGSNGGLLVANMYVRAPQRWGAVVCQAPLLDMRRYSHLLAGASWTAEYGDPDDPEQWAFIRTFSPYHLLGPGRPYPPLLLTTSTRDDRVHPGHARKMAAALEALGYAVTFWENVEGGHAGAADAAQQATATALAFAFFHRHLGTAGPPPGANPGP